MIDKIEYCYLPREVWSTSSRDFTTKRVRFYVTGICFADFSSIMLSFCPPVTHPITVLFCNTGLAFDRLHICPPSSWRVNISPYTTSGLVPFWPEGFQQILAHPIPLDIFVRIFIYNRHSAHRSVEWTLFCWNNPMCERNLVPFV